MSGNSEIKSALAGLLPGDDSAENDYNHSAPAEFIQLQSYDGIQIMLEQGERNGKASFNKDGFERSMTPAFHVMHNLLKLDIAFAKMRAALKSLREARDKAGTVKGTLKWGGRAREHSLGAALLKCKLEIDTVESMRTNLRDQCVALSALVGHFEHKEISLLCKHNLMCANNLLREVGEYLDKLNRNGLADFDKQTSWISLQWRRFTAAGRKWF